MCLVLASQHAALAQPRTVANGVRVGRLAIRNATVVDGNGTPAAPAGY